MDTALVDAQLTAAGVAQAAERRREMKESGLMDRIDLVVTSPLMRTLETATEIFGTRYLRALTLK